MSVSFVRPDVEDLEFHLYDRSVHPELFTTYSSTELWLETYSANVKICEAGHLVCFRFVNREIVEVVAPNGQPLPRRKRVVERRLRGCRDDATRLDCGVRYQMSFQLEKLDPEVFANVHEELLGDCRSALVSHQFPTGSRLSPCALSLIRTDADRRSLLVHAFHTFPESCSVVRTQSLFEI